MITLSSNFLLFPDIADPDLSDIDDSDDIDTGKGDEDCGSGDSSVISSGLCILPVRKKEKIETPFPSPLQQEEIEWTHFFKNQEGQEINTSCLTSQVNKSL